jgi:hypothetical protein
MTLSVGRLIQPFVQVIWGDINLTSYTTEGFPVQPIASNIKIDLSMENVAGKLEFDVPAHPVALDVILKLKEESPDKAIKVRMGYELGTFFETYYQFAGFRLSSGMEPISKVIAVGLPKGPWTDNRISYTMSSEVSLDKFPEFLKGKCGEGCKDIKFQFKGQLLEDAKKVKIKRNDLARTPHSIITDVMFAQGAITSVSDSVIDGSIVFHYPFNLEDEAESEELKLNLKQIQPVVGERKVFILGPGVLSTFNRTQTYNLAHTTLFRGRAAGDQTIEQRNKEDEENKKNYPPQTNSVQSNNKAGGVTGPVTPGQSGSGTTQFSDKQKKAIEARAKKVTSECSVECFMVPYMVGIKPRDIIVIPSLKAADEPYIEDWIVEELSYSIDETGVVNISMTGTRPYTGDVNMLDADSLKKVQEVVKNLRSIDSWSNFYWNIGSEVVGNVTNPPSSLVVSNQEEGELPESLPLFP